MTPSIEMNQTTRMGGGGGFMRSAKRVVGGGGLFLTRYTAQSANGVVCLGFFLGGLAMLVLGVASNTSRVSMIVMGLLSTGFGGGLLLYLAIYVRTLLKKQKSDK